MKTYTVMFMEKPGKICMRHLPENEVEAREYVEKIAAKNDAWCDTLWYCPEDDDEFEIGSDGKLMS